MDRMTVLLSTDWRPAVWEMRARAFPWKLAGHLGIGSTGGRNASQFHGTTEGRQRAFISLLTTCRPDQTSGRQRKGTDEQEKG